MKLGAGAWRYTVWLAVAGCASQMSVAAWDESDPLQLEAKLAYRYDDNLFRLNDAEAPRAGGPRGDSIIEPSLLARFRLPVSRQMLSVEARVFTSLYQHYDDINYTGWDLSGGWNWVVGNSWSGSLGYSDKKSLSSFEDQLVANVDLYRNKRLSGSAAYQVSSNWQLGVNAARIAERHERDTFDSYDQTVWGMSLATATGKGSSLTLSYQQSELEYIERYALLPDLERGYDQSSFDLAWQWPLTGKVEVGGNLGWSTWKSLDGLSDRTDNWLGGLNARWKMTDKTVLDANLSRDYDDPGQNLVRRVRDRVAVGVKSAVTSKVSLGARTGWDQKQTARKDLPDQQQQTWWWRLTSSYQVHRAVALNAFVAAQSRNSDVALEDYDAMQAGVSAEVRF
ncbi:hypothetical protein ACTSKR_12530 [Chitinibacteraceae bacterium HSL-7]